MIKVSAISIDETSLFNIDEEDKPLIESINATYFFDSEKRVYICDLSPSNELHLLDYFIVMNDCDDEEKRDELTEKYCYGEHEDMTYMYCRSVDLIKDKKDCGEFDSMDDAREYLQSNFPF